MTANTPAGFVPTSTHPSWRGKVRCEWCPATGWPTFRPYPQWWGNRHGDNCKHRPAVVAS